MATSNNSRDVRMTLSVDTLGAEDIQKLQRTVAALAKEGGEAAPEFQRLADEIGRLGDQANALKSFTDLAAQTAELAARQAQASTNSQELGARLAALSQVTLEAGTRQSAAAAALNEAQTAARTTRDELARLTITTDAAGRADAAYRDEVQRLKLAKVEQRAEIERLSAALAASNAEVKAAEKAEAALAKSYARAENAAAAAAQAVRANADAVQEAADSALDLGVTTDNIAEAQAELVQNLNRTGRAAADLQANIDRLADAERELAGIRAFEEQAEAAQQLQRASEYAQFWEQALRDLAETERQLAQQQADERWQREAEAIVDAAHAAQELARQTQILEAAQRELAAQRAFEQQAEDARRLIQAADYVRNWEEQLAAAERQARETAEAADAAARRISDAFGTLGVKSAEQLEREIAAVRAAMRTVEAQAGVTGEQLDHAFQAGNQRIQDLERQLREVNGEMTVGDRVADLFSNSIGQIAAGNLVADGVGFLVGKIKDLAGEFVKAIVESQNLRRALQAVYGDTRTAAKQFDFLRQTANAAGVSMGDIVKSFVKFSAATKASGIDLNVTNKLFAEITRSAGILGLSGEEVGGILEALGQIASKGTVSMEELRQQLGDRLPGALSLVAKGLGLTEAQLVKLVESGGLAARDLFVPLTNALSEMKGEASGLTNEYQRLKNILSETATSSGDAVWTQLLAGGLKLLSTVAGGLGIVFSFLSEVIGDVARTIGILASAIVNLTNPMEELNEMLKESRERHDKLTGSILKSISGSTTAAVATAEHAKAMEEAGEAAAIEALAVQTTEKALAAHAFASKLAAEGTYSLSSQMVQVVANIETLLKAQQTQIESDAKLAKAAKIQGDSLVTLTELRGKDFLSIQAQADAQQKYADALDKAAKSQLTQTELLVLERQEIIRISQALGEDTKARKVQLDAIDAKIKASQAETEQANQATAAAQQEASARRLAVQTYKDNASAIGEFKKALEDAEAALQKTIIAERDGYGTKEQVAAATLRAAEAAHLYNDAIKDSVAAIELENRVNQAKMNLVETKLQLEQRSYESLAQAARQSGDFVMALYYEIEARMRQIKIIQLTSEAKRLEAEATIKAIEIEKAALDQADPLLKQKQAELEIRLANAKAKLLEADAGADAVRAIEREIQALRDADEARGRDTDGRKKNADAINKQTSALREKLSAQYDEQNFALDIEGKRINATGEPAPYVASGGDWVYVDKDGRMRRSSEQPVKDPNGGYIDPALAPKDSKNAQLTNPNAGEGGGRKSIFGDPLYGGKPVAADAEASPAQSSTVQTININLGGRTTAVKVASSEDAAALAAVLKQLEDAAGRST